MKELSFLFDAKKPVRALVLGDLMLDKYTTGTIKRISPEAPVTILNVEKKEVRPGGAGNVVLNLLALKAEVTVLGRLGFDEEGKELFSSLRSKGAAVFSLIRQKAYPTTAKNRLIASSQQLIRIDSEKILPLPLRLEKKVLAFLKILIPQMQVVAISDYGKGFLTCSILQEALRLCRFYKVPAIVDPKGADFTKYAGAFILKPNQQEAYLAAKKPFSAALEEVAEKLLDDSKVQKLLITRSEAGMTLFSREKSDPGRKLHRQDFPVLSKEVKDVTGAGDTALAALAVCIANGLDLAEGIKLANLAAGLAIEKLGCAVVTLADLAERLLEFEAKSKLFDQEHFYALGQVLKNKPYALLEVSSKAGMSVRLFREIERLSKLNGKLLVYLKDKKPDGEFVRFLSNLPQVDFIVLKKSSVQKLKSRIRPLETVEIV
ncbi:MAG: bifunctional ADP-heptose synthase [Parachlamydiales bacterium]